MDLTTTAARAKRKLFSAYFLRIFKSADMLFVSRGRAYTPEEIIDPFVNAFISKGDRSKLFEELAIKEIKEKKLTEDAIKTINENFVNLNMITNR